jgi:hypothetical protein
MGVRMYQAEGYCLLCDGKIESVRRSAYGSFCSTDCLLEYGRLRRPREAVVNSHSDGASYGLDDDDGYNGWDRVGAWARAFNDYHGRWPTMDDQCW